jgi:hypothetical protein
MGYKLRHNTSNFDHQTELELAESYMVRKCPAVCMRCLPRSRRALGCTDSHNFYLRSVSPKY